MPADFLGLLERLAETGLEFIIVGGVAARLYGSPRITHDLDVIPKMDDETWAGAVDALWAAGARPRIPEPRERIRDARVVARWVSEKGMIALTLRSPDGEVEVDFLVGRSDRFDALASRATRVELGSHTYHVISIDDLIQMKADAGRPQDHLDVETLRQIKARINPRRS